MTSGQGTAPGSGRPPYGQPPEEPPPYGAPPQGQPPYGQPQQAPPHGQAPQAPPGYPSYGPPGYMPAPSAPTGWGTEAPRALDRPVTVRAGLGAYIASIVLSVVSSVVTVANFDQFVSYIQAQLETQGQQIEGTGLSADDIATLGLRVGIVFSIVFLALYLLFIWFAWRGYNWARIVLWVLAGLGIVSGFAGLAIGSPLPFLTALGGFQMLLLIAAVVFLALKPSNEWYRFRRWQRATGQG
jgi:hypothetical protein